MSIPSPDPAKYPAHGELLNWAKTTMPNATVPRHLGSASR